MSSQFSLDSPDLPANSEQCCAKCGYNLRGLGQQGRCPECGQEFSDAISNARDKKAKNSLQWSIRIFLWTLLAWFLISSCFSAMRWINLFVGPGFHLIFLLIVWRIPLIEGLPTPKPLAIILRILTLIDLVLACFDGAIIYSASITTGPETYAIASAFLVGLSFLSFTAFAWIISRSARRFRSPRLAFQFSFIAILLSITAVLGFSETIVLELPSFFYFSVNHSILCAILVGAYAIMGTTAILWGLVNLGLFARRLRAKPD